MGLRGIGRKATGGKRNGRWHSDAKLYPTILSQRHNISLQYDLFVSNTHKTISFFDSIYVHLVI